MVLLLAKFICADKSPKITNCGLKDAAMHHQYRDQPQTVQLQVCYLTLSGVFVVVKSICFVKFSASLKKS